MNTLETIAKRKSIRSYTGEKISADEMDAILKAANESPVGMGRYESLHLTLIENKELLDELDKAGAELFGRPESHPLYGAPALIIVSAAAGNEALSNAEYSNAAIVVHNMVMAAVSLGIGACHIWGDIMAINANSKLVKKLNLPEGFIPCCGVILGKTTEQYKKRSIPQNRIAINKIL